VHFTEHNRSAGEQLWTHFRFIALACGNQRWGFRMSAMALKNLFWSAMDGSKLPEKLRDGDQPERRAGCMLPQTRAPFSR
jgi:hypothetical protein